MKSWSSRGPQRIEKRGGGHQEVAPPQNLKKLIKSQKTNTGQRERLGGEKRKRKLIKAYEALL